MPQITSALTSLAGSPITKSALDLAQLGSTGYNLYNQYQQQQYQNKLRDLSTNPAAVSKLAEGYTKPLNAGLTTNVANQAQAFLAQRGLSDSPQISEQVEAQAIAPYIQQNEQQGYQNALEALGLGGGAIPPALQQQTGMSDLVKAFSQLGGSGSLARLMQFVNQGNSQANSIPLETDPGINWSIPYQPVQNFDFSNWTPDYSAAAGSNGGS